MKTKLRFCPEDFCINHPHSCDHSDDNPCAGTQAAELATLRMHQNIEKALTPPPPEFTIFRIDTETLGIRHHSTGRIAVIPFPNEMADLACPTSDQLR